MVVCLIKKKTLLTFSNRKPLSMQKNNNYSLKIAVKLKIFHLRRLPAAHFPSAKPQSGTGKKITRFHWPEAWTPQAKFQISTSFFDSLILRLSQVFASEGITQVLMILHDYSCFKKLFSVLCCNQSEKGEKKSFPLMITTTVASCHRGKRGGGFELM